MSGEMQGLPEGWVETTFDDVSHINPNMTLEDEIEVSFLPMSGVPTVYLGNIQSEPRKWREVRKGYTPFQNGDTLFAKVTPCFENGKAVAVSGLSNGFGAGSTELFVLRPLGGISPKYLLGLVKTEDFLRRGAINMTGSVGLKRVPKDFVRTYSIPLAPLAEQKVIADKLDALLAQVDTLKTRLDAIPAILKRFRQSVLSAAVTGKLTEEWRGKPVDWNDVQLGDIASILDPHPSHRTPPEVSNGVPYIGIGDIRDDDSIDFENARKISFDVLEEHKQRYNIKSGDFVFGKIGTLGKSTFLPTGVDYTLSANVILIQSDPSRVLPPYLMFFLSSPDTMSRIIDQSSATSQAAFGIKKMRGFTCELPPLPEQTEIVRRVESLFAFADQIEARTQEATARVKHLTQSILAKAFRGELTEEWRKAHPELVSGQNSAEALLERIRAARAASPEAKGKRGRKGSSESDTSLAMAAESEMVKKRGRPRKG